MTLHDRILNFMCGEVDTLGEAKRITDAVTAIVLQELDESSVMLLGGHYPDGGGGPVVIPMSRVRILLGVSS